MGKRDQAAQRRHANSGGKNEKLKALGGYLADSTARDFDRLVYERVRLGIMSTLAVNRSLSFSDLRDLLQTSDGNLSVHFAHALGLRVKMVLGYSGNEAEMGVLRGELAGIVGSFSSLRPFVDNGYGICLVRVGDKESLSIDVPSADELVRDWQGRSIVRLIESQAELGRITVGPPGIPSDRLAALRTAYRSALEDAGFRAAAAKRHLPIDPSYGEEVARRFREALEQPPATLHLLRSLLDDGS